MLNNEDKKYIQNNIEKKLDKIENKVSNSFKSAQMAETKSGKRLAELLAQNKEKSDKQKLIEELQSKSQKGEATLAEKIELLNLNLKSAFPDDVKDALKNNAQVLKSMGKDVSKGSSQALKGMDSLVTRMMGMNPLTAMLWSAGKGITRDIWNIGAGAAQMGWGVTKGIAQFAGNGIKCAAGLVNSAINMFQKKKKSEKKEEIPVDEDIKIIEDEEKEEEKPQKGEKTSAEKITDIHDFLFKHKFLQKQEKAEITRQSVLAKGLNGLAKGMEVVQDVAKMIASKQKLILAGLLIGAAAVLGLAAWFKSGGMQNAIKGIIDALPWNQDKKVQESIDKHANEVIGDSVDSTVLRGNEYKDYLNLNKDSFTGISGSEKLVTGKTSDGAYETQGRKFNTGSLTPVIAPIDGSISELKGDVGQLNGGDNRMYFSFVLYGYANNKVGSGLSRDVVKLKFENVLNPKVHNKQQVKIGQILGFADGSFKITQVLGDKESGTKILDNYEGFINRSKSMGWDSNIEITTSNITDKDQDYINNDVLDIVEDYNFKQRGTSKYTNALNNIGDRIKNHTVFRSQKDTEQALRDLAAKSYYHNKPKSEQSSDSSNVSSETTSSQTESNESGVPTTVTKVPPSNVNSGNKADDKLEKQRTQIKEIEKPKIEVPQQQDTNETGNTSIVSIPNQSSEGMRRSCELNTNEAVCAMGLNGDR